VADGDVEMDTTLPLVVEVVVATALHDPTMKVVASSSPSNMSRTATTPLVAEEETSRVEDGVAGVVISSNTTVVVVDESAMTKDRPSRLCRLSVSRMRRTPRPQRTTGPRLLSRMVASAPRLHNPRESSIKHLLTSSDRVLIASNRWALRCNLSTDRIIHSNRVVVEGVASTAMAGVAAEAVGVTTATVTTRALRRVSATKSSRSTLLNLNTCHNSSNRAGQ
jgi:hypothetical protein